MAQEYLPAPSNIRLADLMKEHNISQPELAKEIGCSKSTISLRRKPVYQGDLDDIEMYFMAAV